MLEKSLADELQRVGDSLAVPHDLFPADRLAIARRPWWRRPLVAGCATAAALLMLLGATPSGQRTVQAAVETASKWLGFSRSGAVTVVQRETPSPENYFPERDLDAEDYQRLPLGSTTEFPALENGNIHVSRRTVQPMTVADLQALDPSWPLPTYLPPGPDVRLGLHTWYGSGPTTQYIVLAYEVGNGQDIELLVDRNGHTKTQAEMDALQSGKEEGITVELDPGMQRQVVEITALGHPTLAIGTDNRWWSIHFVYAQGSIYIKGDRVPRDEVVKVLDSLAPYPKPLP